MAELRLPRTRVLAVLGAVILLALGLRLWGVRERSLAFDEIDNAYLSSRAPAAWFPFSPRAVERRGVWGYGS